ncbi:arginine utilization regulatory protein [Ureibacillus xyleni]|uniref:Arginine utilization regulatory protein n=1 Tax=Ureibacillus xyleni TaxID=614648 RepID=A0A285SW27_9BACL|nr:sigma 54-interacting transcriptional regulator [Ureibacillus xyleni]SOC12508.1 arginine utilization regulatory protein [Ureibacillus xyleni]
MTIENNISKKFYDFAIDNVSVGIHAIDLNGHTILYNNKMKEIEGYNIEDITDRSILDIFTFNQSDSTLIRVLQTGQKELNVKQTYWNKDGHEITTINDTYPIFENDEIIGAIEFARDITTLEKLIYQPLRRYGEPLTFEMFSVASEQMYNVIENAKKAAKARIPVLLIGESGTGKHLVAESIHHELNPTNDEFVTLFSRRNPQSILDKLHNYLKTNKAYTFFFERIEYLPLSIQKQLIDILNKLPIGKHLVIGSIGDDPIDLISSGKLLKELYYYFATLTIYIPALRARKEDIYPFVSDYFSRHRERFASNIEGMSDEVMQVFLQYDWPGNLKELELLLDEISSMITNEKIITLDMLPLHFRFKVQQADENIRKADFFIVHSNKELLPLEDYMREAENYYIQNVLNIFEGNITKTAQALGMSRQNLQYRLRKLKKD